jgi:selenide,water dikinase
VHPKRIKRNADARVGDRLILGKPLGVGVLSAALKKNALTPEGYAQMIANTTKLNTPGAALSALAGVHAMTDVTGFGLAGHALEMARGSQHTVQLNMSQVPLLHGVRELAEQGMLTGASGRNWSAYGGEISLSAECDAIDQALLSDPQTSGGLLVACAPEEVPQVMAAFKQHGFDHATVIGQVCAKESHALRVSQRLQSLSSAGVA